MRLSVLMCSVVSRIVSRRPLLFSLMSQIGEEKGIDLQEDGYSQKIYSNGHVEILVLTDNKTMSVGKKRNMLLAQAKGEYVVMVDDDDLVTVDYVTELLKGMFAGTDVITFNVAYHHNAKDPKPVYYDINFGKDINEPNCYKRLPNHLMCFKRELAIQAGFPDISFGEDAEFAKRVLPLIKTQHKIDKTLYHYHFNSQTSETQRR